MSAPQMNWRALLADGFVGGAGAGLLLVVAEAAQSFVVGSSATAPIRLTGSIVLGPAALSPAYPLASAVPAFISVHLAVSGVLGVLFVLSLAAFGRLNDNATLLLLLGLAYGSLVWLVGLLIAPIAWPQLLVTGQFWPGLAVHALFFGSPLASFVIISRRRPGQADDSGGK